MKNLGFEIIFIYGMLHALGPDHLTAIVDFSIGKNKRKTLAITILFAIGHGITLFIFAKILNHYIISDNILSYGDKISSGIIIFMGLNLLYMVCANKIHVKKHNHKGKDHMHIYYGNKHSHNKKDTTGAFTVGALMGVGGVRNMLVTLGLIQGHNVDLFMVLFFTLGVMVVFLGFGLIILYINNNLLTNEKNIRLIFTISGLISLIVGGNMFLN